MTASATLHSPHDSKPIPTFAAHALFLLILGIYALLLATFYVPAHPGVDQNGYMTTGRELVEHGRLYFRPHNPYQFIGAMMVQLPDGLVYAKYPPGVGVLAALAWFLGGRNAIYAVDPICVLIGMSAAYVLFLQLVDEFPALIGVVLLMINPVILQFADDADSHGAAFGFTTLGMCLLVIWLRRGGWRWGAAAGIVLGFCPWMRYTEALWCIPLLVALIIARANDRRPWRDVAATAVAYALPILGLAAINWISFGYPWRTGYWYCGEQGGFSWRYLVAGDATSNYQGNWITLLGQFENFGLFLIFPFVALGMGRLLAEQRRWGLLLAAWIIPSAAVYLFYYWAPSQLNTVIYLRFFIDLMPAMILCALWAMMNIFGPFINTRGLTVGLLTFMAGAYCLTRSVPDMERARAVKINLVDAAKTLNRFTGPRAVIFADPPLCDYLGSITNDRLYNLQIFSRPFFLRCLKLAAVRGPHPLQLDRVKAYIRLLGRRTASGRELPPTLAGYHRIETSIIRHAWKHHEKVFYITPDNRTWPTIPRTKGLRIVKLAVWPNMLVRSLRPRRPLRKLPNGGDRIMRMALYGIVPENIKISTATRDLHAHRQAFVHFSAMEMRHLERTPQNNDRFHSAKERRTFYRMNRETTARVSSSRRELPISMEVRPAY